jgi:flagellar assembly factor FliW
MLLPYTFYKHDTFVSLTVQSKYKIECMCVVVVESASEKTTLHLNADHR